MVSELNRQENIFELPNHDIRLVKKVIFRKKIYLEAVCQMPRPLQENTDLPRGWFRFRLDLTWETTAAK